MEIQAWLENFEQIAGEKGKQKGDHYKGNYSSQALKTKESWQELQ